MPQHHPFVKKIATALRHRCGVAEGSKLLVAVSGGADSVALLRAIAMIAPRRGWNLSLSVGHVQHHLRGDAAEQDAAFVAELADGMDLPMLRGDIDPAAAKGNLESRVRRMRYHALTEMADTVGATFIACAHHGDDQLETLLMRLMRGSSAKGMAAMAWRRKLSQHVLIRPMLAVSRDDVRGFLGEIEQTWCEDHTNADITRFRARLRRDVLPVLHDLRPDAAGRAAHIADHFRSIGEVVEQAISRAADHVTLVDGVATFGRIDARQFPQVVLAGLLRRLLREAGIEDDRLGGRVIMPMVRAICDRQGGSRTFTPAAAVKVTLTRDTIQIG